MLRLKSIGQMGYYKKTYTYSLLRMVEIISDYHKHKIIPENSIDGYKEKRSLIYSFNAKAGKMWCKLTDWTVDDSGTPDPESKRRGILTDRYKLAPFFEYYIKNHSQNIRIKEAQ